jgi:hypothetical protein
MPALSVSEPLAASLSPSVREPVAGVADQLVPSVDFRVLYEVAAASAEGGREFEAVLRGLTLLAEKTKIFTISGTNERRRTRARVDTAVLPCPTSANAADQCREMGIAVGDVIQGRETYPGGWNDARLKLVWLSDKTAVWETKTRTSGFQLWEPKGEDSAWTLDCREWRRVDEF